MINSVKRTGASNTARAARRPRGRCEDLGLTAEEAAIVGFGHFPVAGPADYSDDWLACPGFGPPFHLHQGTDIFADRGTPVRAPFDGVVRFTDGGLGGQGRLRHACRTAPTTTSPTSTASVEGARQRRPGRSRARSSASSATPATPAAAAHLHFEIHPKGGAAVNPKPILDDWLDEAIAKVPALCWPPTACNVSRRAWSSAGCPAASTRAARMSIGAGSPDRRAAAVGVVGEPRRAAPSAWPRSRPPGARRSDRLGREPRPRSRRRRDALQQADQAARSRSCARSPRAAPRPARRPQLRRSVPEVLELQGDAEVLRLERGDHRLQVVPLLARAPAPGRPGSGTTRP